MSNQPSSKWREIAIIALISGGHFWSHFFLLTIPSALPLIRTDFGVTNVAMGMVLAASGLMGAAFQYPMGMLCDRYGARVFVIAGLLVESSAMFMQSFASAVPYMVVFATIGGIADSVFHPADYTILTAKVRPAWHGRSYAIHTFSGFSGFAVAPMVMNFLFAHGDWRHAIATIGVAGFITALILLASYRILGGVSYAPKRATSSDDKKNWLQFLLSPPLLIMFVFYVVATVGSNGLQVFGNSALMELYHIDLALANTALSAFLWGTAIGVLGGGLVADKTQRLDAVCAVAYIIATVLLCAIGMRWLSYGWTTGALFFIGFMVGVVLPSRDLMVRTVTPPDSIGKAFGYVSSGFGVAGIAAPLIYGRIMDIDMPQLLFFTAGALMMLTIALALAASYAARRAAEPGALPQPAK